MTTPLDPQFLALQEALAGQYSLDVELGRGGMGIVYLARDVRLDRPVALKLLPQHLATQAELRARFLREARTAAKLSHPNIVPIHSVDEVGDFVFFVMAYVQGLTLGQRVRGRGPLAPSEVARILKEIGWALGYAHSQGVVHRDIKPDNILLEEETGRALVTDFGIAGLIATTPETGIGEIIGTAEYMSPEQASGRGVDARTDIYSLGVVGFYALSGQLPYRADSVIETLRMVQEHPVPTLGSVTPGVPSKLGRAIDRCLAKKPADRFQTAQEFAGAVDTAMGRRLDMPIPVRRFVNDPIDLPGDGPAYTIGAALAAILPVMTAIGYHTTLGGWLLVAGYGASVTTLPLALSWFRIRRLLRGGHTLADVQIALRHQLEERREELAYTRGAPSPHGERTTRMVAYGGLTAAVAAAAVALGFETSLSIGALAQLGMLFGVGSVASLTASLLARDRTKQHIDEKGQRRLTFWKSTVGRWLFKLGGLGVKRPATAIRATHRPTELQIGLAAEALFEHLPREIRGSLGDVPATVHRLEGEAQRVREMIERLAEAQATAGSEGLPPDLVAGKADAERRLTEAVGALEAIRLGLLRLTAGSGDVGSLTTHLQAAGEIGEQIDHMLEGLSEADAALGLSRGSTPPD